MENLNFLYLYQSPSWSLCFLPQLEMLHPFFKFQGVFYFSVGILCSALYYNYFCMYGMSFL